MFTLIPVTKEDYPHGKKLIYEYSSQQYYDLIIKQTENGWKIDLTAKYFDEPFKKYQVEDLFDEDRPNLEYYLAELDGKEIGILSLLHERWNQTLRIENIHVSNHKKRQGIGSRLMDFAKNRARKLGVRALVLETQTSNFPAVQFYLHHGFQLTGFDLLSYSNHDMDKKEVRIEMGCKMV